jgi:hypothetical protein
MLTYSAIATIYLPCIALTGHWTGKLLWPAVAAHSLLTILLALAWPRSRKPQPTASTQPPRSTRPAA